MERVYSSLDPGMAHLVRSLLASAGIAAEVRRELLHGAMLGVAPTEAWVEVWADSARLEEAWMIVRSVLDGGEPEGESWRCAWCGEEIEAQFDCCWKCGAERGAGC